jgi:Zn-dependent protease
LGTIIVPALILLVSKIGGGGGVLFGWAKPVPVNFGNLRRPKQDMLWVAAAGPAANLVMAIGWAFVLKLAVTMPETVYTLPMMKMADAGIDINVVLMALNLLPLPPLDGGRIVVSLLPHRAAWRFAQLERWGFPILLGLLFMGVLGKVLALPIGMIRALIAVVFQFNY